MRRSKNAINWNPITWSSPRYNFGTFEKRDSLIFRVSDTQ
jgi:hypothetical protein